jgi:sucrose phosphorylase
LTAVETEMETLARIRRSLACLYPDRQEEAYRAVSSLLEKWRGESFSSYPWVDHRDILLIAYGDGILKSGMSPLAAFKQFMDREFRNTVNLIHLLPMFPYSSDDGFSVIDFREIDPALGSWDDISALNSGYDLMFDAVINHASRKSPYFEGYIRGEEKYRDFFIDADPAADYSAVIRPRSLPLLSPVESPDGLKYIWTTFSDDQMDFNYRNPAVLAEMLDILLLYASRGARFIRFDAAGFVWKAAGTSCMHLPQAHELIKLMRACLQIRAPGCSIITETNVPHRDNISYFGSGDEAAMVYQFPLPPLTLFSFLSGSAERLSGWAAALEPAGPGTAYFNFLASHDGIGLRPVEDILSGEERELMIRETLKRGGEISCRAAPGGGEVPYELNINYLDAVAADAADDLTRARKFMASQCILLSMMGLPAIYYHSLVGSRGDRAGFLRSGIKRRINREKLDLDTLESQLGEGGHLRGLVASRYKKLLALRKELPAFHPNSPQEVLHLRPELFALLRGRDRRILVLVNVSGKELRARTGLPGLDRISGESCGADVTMAPWQYRWIEPGP